MIMEILSTGEKIKRARVYKGYTLKDLCGDKISVSKMSCIENEKIKAEEWILDFIAEKLEIDPMYLKQDVKSQVAENIKEIERGGYSDWYEKELEYNLKFSEELLYSDLAFYIMHLLFNYYLDEMKIEKVQLIVSKYYDYWQKHFSEESEAIYYMDIARYFYNTKEFSQAANYYSNVKLISKGTNNSILLARATYNEAACYVMLENYEKAYEISMELINLMEYIESNTKKAEAYHMLAILALRKNKTKFHEYEQKSYELYKNNFAHRAQAIYNYAVVMFSEGFIDAAIDYINRALECFPKDSRETLVNFMLMCTNKLIENNILDKAKTVCDEALNYSIDLNNIMFIEKSYYYKALILEKEGNMISAEMHMNLALDALLKFANKNEIYKRYMEMGNMYYRMENVNESIKYFNFAIQLEKKM